MDRIMVRTGKPRPTVESLLRTPRRAGREAARNVREEARPTRAARERVTTAREGVPGGADLTDSERGLSSAAAAYRRAEPYLAASSTLMGSVATFTALGYLLDRWMGHSVQWLLIAGSVTGIAVGFLGFFRQVARADARRG